MKRALLISIHPEWAEKILNGEKTIEIRTWIPKDYVGWVYVAITKGKPYLYNIIDSDYYSKPNILNGKVAFRFWFSGYYYIIQWDYLNQHYYCHKQEGLYSRFVRWLMKETQLTIEQINNYGKGKTIYAWHIDKLEIFDKPKELSEFYRGYDILGNEHKPYLTHQITKAPQKCAWVYIDEKPEPHQAKVLDEETPNKKDESERKPF